MPRINLLPWREERRKERQKQFNFLAIGVLVLGAVLVLYWNLTVGHFISYQEQRNAYLQSQIKILDKDIAAIKDLRKTRDQLLARMRIIEQLQRSRPEVVHLFDELVKTLPDGVYLTEIKQQGNVITIDGVAESSARVSAYMRNIDGSKWLGDPDLKIVEKSNKNSKTGIRRQAFTVTAKEIDKAAANTDKQKSGKQRGNAA